MAKITSFPSALDDSLTLRGLPLAQVNPGKAFWVGNSAVLLDGESTAADVAGQGTFLNPFSTIDFAIGQCGASRGDIIYVRPNHTVTVTAAAGIALDVAGVAIIGLGVGSLRPTINFTTVTTASMTISAASCTISNLLFTGGIDALVTPINVTGADCAVLNCEWRDLSTFAAVTALRLGVGATRALVQGWRHDGQVAIVATTLSSISAIGIDRPTIDGFDIDGNFIATGAPVHFLTTLSTDVEVRNGYMRNRLSGNTANAVLAITNTTGRVGPNVYYAATGAQSLAELGAAFEGDQLQFLGDIEATDGVDTIISTKVKTVAS